MKRFFATILAYLLILQPFLAWSADPVYELECTSTGCSDTVQSVAVSAVVAGTSYPTGSDGLPRAVTANTVLTEYQDGKWRMRNNPLAANLCTYSDDLTQAVWAKTTMTAAMTQTGPRGTANESSLITATGANATILFTATSPNGAHTASFYLKRVTGTGSVSVTANNGSTWTAKTITSSWVRYTETQTTTNPVIGIKLATSGDQVAVGLSQVQTGSFATLPIPTSGAIGISPPTEGAVDTTDIFSVVNLTVDAINFTDGAAAADFAAVNLNQYVKTGNKYRVTLLDDEGDAAVAFIYADDPTNAGGALLVSATGGSTRNWASKAAGFNTLDTEFTCTIEYVETNGYTQPNASLWGGDGWTAGTNMNTAGTMIVDWWPLSAQSTYPTNYPGIISLYNSSSSLLYFTSGMGLTSFDGTAGNSHQIDWTTAANHKIGLTWSTVTDLIELYQDGPRSTDPTHAYDGDTSGWTVGTNFVFFFDNPMPTLLSGLKFYSVAATEAKVSSSAASDVFTSSVIDGVTGAVPSIKGLSIAHATCEIDRVTAAALQYDFYFTESLATNFINSIAVGHGDAVGIYVATGKAVSGDYNAWPNHAATPTALYTDGGHSVWGSDPLFTDEAGGDYSLTAGSPMIDAGTGSTTDINAVDPATNGYADTAVCSTPADEGTGVAVLPTLTSAAFALTGEVDIGAYEFVAATHTASQWQIDEDGGGFGTPVWDSTEDAVNLESIAVATRLLNNTAYDWRVRHKTAAGWSAWSTAFDFTSVASSAGGSGRGLSRGGMGMQMH
jgi:hypothetical protein